VDPGTLATIAGLPGPWAKEATRACHKILRQQDAQDREIALAARTEHTRSICRDGPLTSLLTSYYSSSSLASSGVPQYRLRVLDKELPATVVGPPGLQLNCPMSHQRSQLVVPDMTVPDVAPKDMAQLMADIETRHLCLRDAPLYSLVGFKFLQDDVRLSFALRPWHLRVGTALDSDH
jgi:hypothetical protein